MGQKGLVGFLVGALVVVAIVAADKMLGVSDKLVGLVGGKRS